jgi:hypothetical protein
MSFGNFMVLLAHLSLFVTFTFLVAFWLIPFHVANHHSVVPINMFISILPTFGFEAEHGPIPFSCNIKTPARVTPHFAACHLFIVSLSFHNWLILFCSSWSYGRCPVLYLSVA